MDKLIFERIWDEYDCYEIKINAVSKLISAATTVYVQDKNIIKLSNGILKFVQDTNNSFCWEISKKGDKYIPYVSLNFMKKDRQGHICIEVYMEIDDGGSLEKHNCCFFIETEIGLLYEFSKKILTLNDNNIGNKVSLNNNFS